jgi:hypothetical protein
MDDLVKWVREEQVVLWDDLYEAIGSSVNGAWSIRAANVARRIVEAARLVGPTPHGEIHYSLVAGGVYEAVLAAGGIESELPDEQEWQRLDLLMAKHGVTRATAQPRLAATVAVINSDRERNWINGGEE